jgi:hypothetical protein
MAVTSNQSCEPKLHLREGAIYSDSSNNIIRLLSIRGDYCAYVYVASGNPRSEIHGSVTGLTRRNAFEAGFVFVAERTEDWNGSQRKRSDRGSSFTYSILPWLNRCRVGVRTSKKEVMMPPQFSRRMKRLKI